MATGIQRQGDDATLLAYRLRASVDHHRLKLRALRQRNRMLHALAASNLEGKLGVGRAMAGLKRKVGNVYGERPALDAFGT